MSAPSAPPALAVQPDIQLRFLNPRDVGEVKCLCKDWFPIEYPDSWFEDITSGSRFYSLAATYHSRIIGLIVAELKPQLKLNKEDSDILASFFPPSTQVAYILSLGVVGEFRRNGIASLLLDSLLSHLTSQDSLECKAVYLHVLATNTVALRFYERRRFRRHLFLPYYYAIQGKARDGFSYVLYINGGQPPWTLIDYLSHLSSHLSQLSSLVARLQPCALPHHVYSAVSGLVQRLVSGSSTHDPVYQAAGCHNS